MQATPSCRFNSLEIEFHVASVGEVVTAFTLNSAHDDFLGLREIRG